MKFKPELDEILKKMNIYLDFSIIMFVVWKKKKFIKHVNKKPWHPSLICIMKIQTELLEQRFEGEII